jgi:glutamine cyclotransferase
MRLKSIVLLVLCSCAFTACKPSAPKNLGFKIVASRPHDPTSYTQGFQLVDGRLFESAGKYGESALREIEPTTGKVLRKRPLAKTVFGEGMTLLGDQLWVLTWKENTAYVFERDTFKPLLTHPYEGEGWGLTTDGTLLIMSNGSSELTFRNPKDFSIVRTLTVKDGNHAVDHLNELEMVDGQIFANIYQSDRIARISPQSGQVTGWLDLKGLRYQLPAVGRAEVLNGIAWDMETGHLLVTGKYWPLMFEIKISEK